jgi:hypothetical protein
VGRSVLLNGLLLALIAGAIGSVQLVDRGSSAVEDAVRRYAAAVTVQDLERATAELAPASRLEWALWVEGQLGNIYEVKGIGVRSPSLLDRLLRGAPAGPVEVTVVLDVNRGYPEQFYQPTTRVGVTRVEGRWYLVEPLLAPEAQG